MASESQDVTGVSLTIQQMMNSYYSYPQSQGSSLVDIRLELDCGADCPDTLAHTVIVHSE